MHDQRLGDLTPDRMERIERRHRLLEDHRDAVAAHGLQLRFVEADSSRPSKRIAPEVSAPSGSRPIIASAVSVLPEPDSPTMPSV